MVPGIDMRLVTTEESFCFLPCFLCGGRSLISLLWVAKDTPKCAHRTHTTYTHTLASRGNERTFTAYQKSLKFLSQQSRNGPEHMVPDWVCSANVSAPATNLLSFLNVSGPFRQPTPMSDLRRPLLPSRCSSNGPLL